MEIFEVVPWQAWIVLSGLMSAVAQVVRKNMVHKMGVFQMGFWRDVGSVLILLPILMTTALGQLGWEVGVLLALGLLTAVGTGAYFSAMRENMSGTAVFSYTAGQLFILLGAFVLFGEWKYFDPSSWRGIVNGVSVLIFFAGMYLYGGGFGNKWGKMMGLTIAVNVVANLFSKHYLSLGFAPILVTICQYAGGLVGDYYLVRRKGQSLRIGRGEVVTGVLQGMLGAVAILMYMTALSFAPLSLVSMTKRVTVLFFTIVAGMIWYGERKGMSWRKIVGLVVGILVFGMVAIVNG